MTFFTSMLSLFLVYFLLHFVTAFNACLRGHRCDGSNHGGVVVEGEMQIHRARQNVK